MGTESPNQSDEITETKMPGEKKPAVDEAQLVTSLKAGEKEAIGMLYDMYAAALYGVIYRIVRSESVAEDVLQETFVRIWKNVASYDGSKGRLFTWLINIARNLAIDKIKSKDFRNSKKNLELENIVHDVESQTQTSYNTDHIGLKDLLEKLNSDQRQIVNLIYFQGYTQSEVAETLGVPLGTVKTRLRSAISFFRTIVA